MNLKINIKPEYHLTPPKLDIFLNSQKMDACIFNNTNETHCFEFEVNDNDLENNLLELHRYGKLPEDTIIENNIITKDQIVHIEKILIDDFEITELLNMGIFYFDYPEEWKKQQEKKGITLPEYQNYETSLFHNGIWELKFTMPIHVWIFQNINTDI